MSVLFMETDVAAVTAGSTSAGWVSGSIASLAASGTANCIFDLGPTWRDMSLATIAVTPAGPSSGLNAVSISSSNTAAADTTRKLKDVATAGPSAISATITVATGCQQFMVRPMGRFLVVTATNADGVNALGASSKVVVVAYTV